MTLLKPCADCGELSDQAQCPDHRPVRTDARPKNAKDRGYDSAWDRLSRQARRRQPFCSVPGCTSTDLTTDHTPEAWERKSRGLPIRLRDIRVLCRSHNSQAGAARGPQTRGDDPLDLHSDPWAAVEVLVTPGRAVSERGA